MIYTGTHSEITSANTVITRYAWAGLILSGLRDIHADSPNKLAWDAFKTAGLLVNVPADPCWLAPRDARAGPMKTWATPSGVYPDEVSPASSWEIPAPDTLSDVFFSGVMFPSGVDTEVTISGQTMTIRAFIAYVASKVTEATGLVAQ